MKRNVWVVMMNGDPEYASMDYYDAWDRYLQLKRMGYNVEFHLEQQDF